MRTSLHSVLHSLLLLLALVAVLAFARPAAADPEPARPRAHRTFALVVTSNKSARLARPDLRYADDDGAKYRELFRLFAPEDAVSLLTSFDRDTARLFPDLAGKVARPQRGHVFAEAARLGRSAAAALAQGDEVDFYFVFAGHGDVERGRGFLELEDGALWPEDLEALLKSVPSTRAHVVIDACNSFFVLAARKPGGHRFATASDAATSLSQRLPNVGVFLSTSAEAETFEWSELGGGIFSHIVRSGLSGAADANHDGEVSYDELAAFAHVASAEVKNPRFRPQVFARGPGGRGDVALVRTRDAAGARITLSLGAGRVTVRDGDEIPWLDVHPEAGNVASLVAPTRVADAYAATSATAAGSSGSSSSAVVATASVDARGAGDVYRALFARPFGPRAFAEYQSEMEHAPPAVYGVADDDTRRMQELLGQTAANARSQRQLQGLGLAAGAVAFGAFGAETLFGGKEGQAAGAGMYFGIAGVLAGTSVYRLAFRSREERALSWFEAQRAGRASAQLTYDAESRLFAMAEDDRRERILWRWIGVGVGTLAVGTEALLVLSEYKDGAPKGETLVVGGGLTLATAAAFAVPIIGTFSPTYTERTAKVWANDPSRAQNDARLSAPTFTVRPQIGLGSFGLGGTF